MAIIDEGRDVFEGLIHIARGEAGIYGLESELHGGYRFIESLEDVASMDLVFSDLRDSDVALMSRLQAIAPILALDDRGAGKGRAHITIYSLPTLEGIKGNFNGPSYVALGAGAGDEKPLPGDERGGILVTFGGTDPHNLSGYVTAVLNSLGFRPTVVRGPGFRGELSGVDCSIIERPTTLYPLLGKAEVVITSFGTTMYEAFLLKTPVLLFNHSQYHWKLASKIDVLNLGFFPDTTRDELRERLKTALEDKVELWRRAERNALLVDGRGAARIAVIIKDALRSQRKGCLFNHSASIALRRDADHSFLQCMKCKDLFIFNLRGTSERYEDREYFLSEYERQYGKTYVDDRQNIVRLGERRIRVVERCRKGPRGTLLDIGCALGFFLEVARNRGWEAVGVEVSPFASEWARKHLSLKVITGSFLDADFEPQSFDVVTLFFVAEHFQNVEKVIEKIITILKKRGLIALALPNRGGIGYLADRENYIESHPRDHYFDTNVRNMVRFLKGYGFRKKKVVATGIHPERFLKKVGIEKNRPLFSLLYTGFVRVFKLGDTFEYYGIKT